MRFDASSRCEIMCLLSRFFRRAAIALAVLAAAHPRRPTAASRSPRARYQMPVAPPAPVFVRDRASEPAADPVVARRRCSPADLGSSRGRERSTCPSPAETALLIASMLSNSNAGFALDATSLQPGAAQLAVWHALILEDQRTLRDISRRHLRRNGIVGGGQDRDHRIGAHRHRIEVRCFDRQRGESHVDFVGQQRFGYAVRCAGGHGDLDIRIGVAQIFAAPAEAERRVPSARHQSARGRRCQSL